MRQRRTSIRTSCSSTVKLSLLLPMSLVINSKVLSVWSSHSLSAARRRSKSSFCCVRTSDWGRRVDESAYVREELTENETASLPPLRDTVTVCVPAGVVETTSSTPDLAICNRTKDAKPTRGLSMTCIESIPVWIVSSLPMRHSLHFRWQLPCRAKVCQVRKTIWTCLNLRRMSFMRSKRQRSS